MADKEKSEKALAIKKSGRTGVLGMAEEMDALFDRIMGGGAPGAFMRLWGRPSRFPDMMWAPDVDVFEREGKVIVRADLPGVKKDDISVEVVENALVIRGSRKEEKEVKKENYYRSERFEGEFSRAIRVPEGVDTNTIEATYQDGVLEVTIPCPAAVGSKTTKVTVK